MNDLPLIDGRGFTTTPETLVEAIGRAILSYRNRTGQEPTHIALPSWADLAGLDLSLSLARPTGAGGPVIVGRAQNGIDKDTQDEQDNEKENPIHPVCPCEISYLRGGVCGDCGAEPIGPPVSRCWACGYDARE